MNRRNFLKTSAAASVFGGLGLSAAQPGTPQEYYELRVYRLAPGVDRGLLDTYLEKAAIPALNRLGSKSVGAFIDSEAKEDLSLYLLIPYSSLESYAQVTAKL